MNLSRWFLYATISLLASFSSLTGSSGLTCFAIHTDTGTIAPLLQPPVTGFDNGCGVSQVKAVSNSILAVDPNPLRNISQISLPVGFKGPIYIYDLSGKPIRTFNSEGLRNIQLSRQDFVPGVYLIKAVEKTGAIITTKLLVE